MLSDGEYGIITNVKIEKLSIPETTYNLEVEDFHTYYVGTNGVLVHNAGGSCGGNKPFIEHDTYNTMRNKIGKDGADEFVEAMNKGMVGAKGQSGIKMLSGSGTKIGGNVYQYEVKVFGKFANYRLYGNYSVEYKTIVFNLFGKALH